MQLRIIFICYLDNICKYVARVMIFENFLGDSSLDNKAQNLTYYLKVINIKLEQLF